jgi:hypothetical protein
LGFKITDQYTKKKISLSIPFPGLGQLLNPHHFNSGEEGGGFEAQEFGGPRRCRRFSKGCVVRPL